MKNIGKEIHTKLRKEWDRLRRASSRQIHPGVMAQNVYKQLKPGSLKAEIKFLSLTKLRELAGKVCVERSIETQEPVTDAPDAQTTLEAKAATQLYLYLQEWYIVERNGEDVSVPREDMTIAERRKMATNLRKESRSKARHADELDAETDDLVSRGILKDPPKTA